MKKLMIIVFVLVVAVAAAGFIAPTEYHVDSGIVINAPPEAIHVYVADLTKWPEWTPWEQEDESVETTMGDITSGLGASQYWTSDDGDGELTITKSDPATGITYEMAFIMEGERVPATSSVNYVVVEGGTRVTWTMEGDWKGAMPPIIDGIMQLLSPWMIGGAFDQGMGNLKRVVEAGA